MITTLIQSLLAVLIFASIAYYLVCGFAALKFFSSPPCSGGGGPRGECPPVSLLVPLCGADFEAYENYARLCRLDYPVFEIVFGVQSPVDSSIPVVQRLMADFPRVAVQLVIGDEVVGENPKVNNLHNMLKHVSHEYLVIIDSDIRVESDFLWKVLAPFSRERVGLVTCLYRAGKAENLASRLEALSISAEFAPGVLVAHWLEGMTFSLGAVMATSRNRLQSIGGFEAIADYLADDFMLGHLLWKAGYEIELLPYVVETLHPHTGLRSMLKHQVRWGRGIRACRPAGYLGSIVTHGTALALIYAVITCGSGHALFLAAATLAVRLHTARLISLRCLEDPTLRGGTWLLIVRDLLGFLVWCSTVVGRKVEWRGKTYRLMENGKIVAVSRPL